MKTFPSHDAKDQSNTIKMIWTKSIFDHDIKHDMGKNNIFDHEKITKLSWYLVKENKFLLSCMRKGSCINRKSNCVF